MSYMWRTGDLIPIDLPMTTPIAEASAEAAIKCPLHFRSRGRCSLHSLATLNNSKHERHRVYLRKATVKF